MPTRGLKIDAMVAGFARHNGAIRAAPTAAGGITRAAYAWALRAKLDVKPLLARARLTVQQVKDVTARIGVQNQVKFLNLVSEAAQDDYLGIRLAQTFDLRSLGLLYYVPASSE